MRRRSSYDRAGRTISGAALALPTVAIAQEVIVIRARELLDGTGRLLGPLTVVVEGSTITNVSGDLSRAPTYDLSNLTLMPGGIDTHVHIGSHFDEDGRVHRPRDHSPEPPATLALYVAENAYVTLMSGITTVQCQGRTKIRPRWRRKIRPSGCRVACVNVAARVGWSGVWERPLGPDGVEARRGQPGGVAGGEVRTRGRSRLDERACCVRGESCRRSAPGCGRDG